MLGVKLRGGRVERIKIMLISPPTDNAISKILGAAGPPLLAYLASMIRDEHDVRVVDSAAGELDKKQ
jgi:anaerobic magnesium-protoporphyrin IX monomethyl ester cyclase